MPVEVDYGRDVFTVRLGGWTVKSGVEAGRTDGTVVVLTVEEAGRHDDWNMLMDARQGSEGM